MNTETKAGFNRLEKMVSERTEALTVANRRLHEEISERKKAEQALQRLNRELRAISNCNQKLMRATDEQVLLNDICRIVCEEAGYRMAWVGYAENDDEKSVRPVAWAGNETGYLAEARITWADTERGRGPTGRSIRNGESVCFQDFATDPAAVPWREGALRRGYRSSIALPLKDESQKTYGALTIYSSEPSTFDIGEVRLLEELAGDLAFGIRVLRNRIEQKRLAQESQENLRFFEGMDRINRAIQGTNNLDQMMSDVLDVVLSLFDCDRAWLLYPCDPGAASWSVPMERTKPEYPGANVQGLEIPMEPESQRIFRTVRGTDGPVPFGPGSDYPLAEWTRQQFGVQSQLSMATYPKTGKPWMSGMHQCSHARVWQQEELRLFQEINRRLADGLTSLLSLRDLQESETKYRMIVDTANEGIWGLAPDTRTEFVNARMAEMIGYRVEEMIGRFFTDFMFEEDLDDHRFRIEYSRKGISGTYERRFRRKDSAVVWTQVSATPVFDERHEYHGSFGMFTDITERKRAEEQLSERIVLAELSADIGASLAKQADLQTMLKECAEALVRHLDAAFARIWTFNSADNVLELRTSAGMYTHIDGAHSRVPLGEFKIGLIAAERRPHITNSVIGDPRVHDQEWAKREGMVSFAGHPLVLADKLVGVIALFSRKPLTDATIKALAFVADEIAVGIERKTAEEEILGLNREFDQRLKERTAELEKANAELTHMNKIFIGRELRMIELKEEIKELEQQTAAAKQRGPS